MRWYHALLRLYPQSFRAEYGDEMAAIFAERLRGAAGWRPWLSLWLEAILDAAVNAPAPPRRSPRAGRAARSPHAATNSGLHRGGGPHRRDGHRSHHRDVRRRRPCADSATAIPGSRSPGEAVPGPDLSRLPADGGGAAEFSRLEARQPVVRTAGGLHVAVRNARRGRRAVAPEWRHRDRRPLRHAGRAGRAGAGAHHRGRPRWRRAGARDQPSVVDHAVRRAVVCHRTIGPPR